MRRLVTIVLAGLLLGCPRASSDTDAAVEPSVDAAVVDSGVELDAGIPQLVITVSVAADGGVVDQLNFDAGVAETDALSTMTLSMPVRLKDFRVRLFDERESVVPSDDSLRLTDAGWQYEINLLQPLKSGRQYVLSVEPEVGTSILDEAGRAWDEQRLTLKVRGAPVDEPANSDQPKKRSRKRSK